MATAAWPRLSAPRAAHGRLGPGAGRSATFLDGAGWGRCRTGRHFIGDASARSYEIDLAGRPSDPHPDELAPAGARPAGPRRQAPMPRSPTPRSSVSAFVAIDGACCARAALASRRSTLSDLDQGFLLLEHLGSESISRPARRADRGALRRRRPNCSPMLHAEAWPSEEPRPAPSSTRSRPSTATAMMIEAELLLDWYVPAVLGAPAGEPRRAAGFAAAWNAVLDRLQASEYALHAARLPFAQHHLARRAHRPRPPRHRRLPGCADRPVGLRCRLAGAWTHVSPCRRRSRQRTSTPMSRRGRRRRRLRRRRASRWPMRSWRRSATPRSSASSSGSHRRDGKPDYLNTCRASATICGGRSRIRRWRPGRDALPGRPDVLRGRVRREQRGPDYRDGAGRRARQTHAADHRHDAQAAGPDRRQDAARLRAWTAWPPPASTKAVVNVHYLPDQIVAHVVGERSAADRHLRRKRRAARFRPAASSRRCRNSASDPFYILNADTFWIDGAALQSRRASPLHGTRREWIFC